MTNRARLLSAFGIVTTLSIAIACGSETGSDGSSGGASSSSGGESSSGFGSSGTNSSSGSSGDDNDAAACFAPIDMYIMFDRSGSMGNDCNIGDTTGSKWCRAINALSGYLKSPSAKDQGAALQFFSEQDSPNCNTGAPYTAAASPASSFTTLPSNSFDAVLNAAIPVGGTPMEAAIRGLTSFTAANRRGGRVTIGILITDGNPQSCNTDLDDLSDLLENHYNATNVRTYVIGMTGADFNNLERIAQGGNAPLHPDTVGTLTNACGNGNGPCRHWNVGDGDPEGFIQALAAIQESADGCKDGGGVVNPPN